MWKVYEKELRFSEAVPVFKRAIDEYPRDAWFYIFVAHSYKMLKKISEALPYYEKALTLAPENKGVIRNVYYGYLSYAGKRGFRDKEWKDAIKWYKKAILLNSEKYQAYNLIGNAYRNAGHLNRGLKYLAKAFSLDPNHIKTKGLGANFRVTTLAGLTQKDKEESVNWAKLAVKAYPDNRKMLVYSAVAFLKAGKKDEYKSLYGKVFNSVTKRVLTNTEKLYFGDFLAISEFRKISSELSTDYKVDDLIGKLIRDHIKDLGYYEQMKNPLQEEALWFFHRSVKKYVDQNPYKQKILMTSPLRKKFCSTQGAGGKSYHYGLKGHFSYDFSLCGKNSMGVPIYAVADGIVVKIRQTEKDNPYKAPVNLKAKANYIIIKHGDITSRYVHIKKNSALVTVGQRVVRGQQIAVIGNSGVSGGPHLHFTVKNKKGYSIEPNIRDLMGYPKKKGPLRLLKTFYPQYEYYVE